MSKKVEKTIEMPAKAADAWLGALKSGKYQQGTGTLCNRGNYWGSGEPEYCCLGVLQDTLGKVQLGDLPTLRWLKDHKIKVNYNTETFKKDGGLLEEGRNTLVDIVLNPPIKHGAREYHSVAELNDSGKFTFKQIARILDKRIKRV